MEQEEAKMKENQIKRINLEKERKERLFEMAEKANKLRNQSIQKACFEILKAQLSVKRDLDKKCKSYIEHREK